MSKKPLALLAGVTLVAALLALAPIASAATNTSEDHGDLSLAIHAYAEQNGVDLETAAAAIGDQQVLIDAMNESPLSMEDRADVWFDQHDGKQTLNTRTTDAGIISAVRQLDLSESTRVSVHDEATFAEQGKVLTTRISDAVLRVTPGATGMYIDVSDAALVVSTLDPADEAVRNAIANATGVRDVRVSHVDSAGDTLDIRGGVGLASCTAGFTASYGSYLGYVTAAHCASPQTTYGNTAGTGSSISASVYTQVHNANADIAFFRITPGNNIINAFYGSSSSTATVLSGYQSVAVGTTVCHRGKTTGASCGQVTSITFKPTYSNACPGTTCNPVFVSVKNVSNSGGDSGGPWYNGSSAIGINKGNQGSEAIYSKIAYRPASVYLYNLGY